MLLPMFKGHWTLQHSCAHITYAAVNSDPRHRSAPELGGEVQARATGLRGSGGS